MADKAKRHGRLGLSTVSFGLNCKTMLSAKTSYYAIKLFLIRY